MSHVTKIFNEDGTLKRGVIAISIPPTRCKKIDNALTLALGDKKNKKSEHICDCIESGPLETMYQARNELALEFIRVKVDPPWTHEKLAEMVVNVEKALRGWPMITTTQFVEQGSPEHKEWVRVFVEEGEK